MTDRIDAGENLLDMPEIADAPVTPATGIAAIALNFALKWHDMSIVKDGALYQQFKLEGRNIETMDLADVFETAMKFEAHLLGSQNRLSEIIFDALADAADTVVGAEE